MLKLIVRAAALLALLSCAPAYPQEDQQHEELSALFLAADRFRQAAQLELARYVFLETECRQQELTSELCDAIEPSDEFDEAFHSYKESREAACKSMGYTSCLDMFREIREQRGCKLAVSVTDCVDQTPKAGKSLSAEALPKRRFVADRRELCGLVEDNVEARRRHGHAATDESIRITSLVIRCLREGLPRWICNEMEESDEYKSAYFSFLRSTDTINDFLESRCLDEMNTTVAGASCVVGASQFPNRHIKRLSYPNYHVLEQGLTRADAMKLAEKRGADLECDVLPLDDDTHNSLQYAVYHVWK